MSQTPLIEVRQLNKYYGSGGSKLHVLKDIDVDIYEGEFVSIMGPSGSGKSTLINVLGFLDEKFEGVYNYNGKPIEDRSDKQISRLRNQEVGFVFQSFNLIESMTVEENVRLPLLYNGYTTRKTKTRVKEVLEGVGLGDKLNSKPSELSGGQRQRVAIARALVNSPKFIIADEPTGALDTKTSVVIMDILTKLNQEGVTIVMVTHDPRMQSYASKHLMIVDGVLAEADSREAENLTEQFNLTYADAEDPFEVEGVSD